MWTALGLIAAGTIGGLGVASLADNASSKKNLTKAEKQLKQYANIKSDQEFNAYLRDNMFMGNIDGATYKNTLAAYDKLKSYNYDASKITSSERKAITKLYNQLYSNDNSFKSLWDDRYSKMSDDEKLAFLKGAGTFGGTVPAPAYLDTSFDRYQKEVEPLTHYTNKELADLYNIDYDFESIKRDYDAAAQAQVNYTDWMSDLLANNAERNNTTDATSYLDAIRNIKSEAIQNGMSNGARAAADLLAANEVIKNKVANNQDVATQRFEAINDALLNRAQTELNTLDIYGNLAQSLGSSATQLYANDVNRKGQDLLSNANFLSADENLRSNRQAQNNLMRSIYNSVAAQNASINASANADFNYFKDISLPTAGGNFTKALSSYIDRGYQQDTGSDDPMSKWGSMVAK